MFRDACPPNDIMDKGSGKNDVNVTLPAIQSYFLEDCMHKPIHQPSAEQPTCFLRSSSK